MTETDRLKYLRIALLLVGAILVVGIYPLTIIWPCSNRTAAGRHRRWRRTRDGERLQSGLLRRSGIYFLVTVSGLLARR